MAEETQAENVVAEPAVIEPALEPAPVLEPVIEPTSVSVEPELTPTAQPVEPLNPEPVSEPPTPEPVPEPLPTQEPIPAPIELVSTPETVPPPQGQISTPPIIQTSLARELLVKAREIIQFRKRKKLERIMSLFLKQSSITNDDVQKLLYVSDATATRYLDQLEKEGKIRRVNTGKYSSYSRM